MKMKKTLTIISMVVLAVCVAVICGVLGYTIANNAALSQTVPPGSVTGGQGSDEVSDLMKIYNEATKAGYEGSYIEFLSNYKAIIEEFLNNNVNVGEQTYYPLSGADIGALSVVKIMSYFNVQTYNGSYRVASGGAGVVYKMTAEGDAYILTNYHVVYELSSTGLEAMPHVSDDIRLWLFGGEVESARLKAVFIGGAIDYDVAVLLVKGDDIIVEDDANGGVHTNADVLKNSAVRPVAVANSDEVSVGDDVYAIGNPAGEGVAVTKGVVSVDAEYINIQAINSNATRIVQLLAMRIDAPINHGNSGGGIFNACGEYIGTSNARDESDGVRDFGYAIPSNLTTAIADNAIAVYEKGAQNEKYGVKKADLGVTLEAIASRSVYDPKKGAAHIQQTLEVYSVKGASPLYPYLALDDVFVSYSTATLSGQFTRLHQLTVLEFLLRPGDTLRLEIQHADATSPVILEIALTDAHFTTIH